VLVIDDSAFMRKLISDFLNEHPEIEVIGTARNGKEGLEKIEALNPTVVTLDVEMPILNGLDTLKIIMDQNPLPVIMLSSTTKAGAEITIRCLQYGAFDFLTKPSGPISLDLHKIKNQLIEKVLEAASARVKVEKSIVEVKPKNTETTIEIKRINQTNKKVLVGIGTSTGGPRALQEVIPYLSKETNASYFIVQHMPPGFTQSLADRLNSMSQVTVKEARHGEFIQSGVVYIAPGGYHMQVVEEVGKNLKIEILDSTQKSSYRPSVDILFQSLSQLEDYHKIAVIMTGMGHDGTKGLKELKLAGNVTTIAQSEESSIIFGMPKSAIEANVVDHIVDLKDIPHTIQRLI